MRKILVYFLLVLVVIFIAYFYAAKPKSETITPEEYSKLRKLPYQEQEPQKIFKDLNKTPFENDSFNKTINKTKAYLNGKEPSSKSYTPTKAELDFISRNMVSGGVPKDGIPSIDSPKYVSSEEAKLGDDELVFGINHKGFVAAYPKKILYWHEIVNEEIGGEKISVTYCPLTESVIAYEGEFGVSGDLYNSNLVMYDKKSDSLWPQILGFSVSGPRKMEMLEKLHVFVAKWGDWKKKHPETKVLSSDTGFGRDYERNPYPGYDSILRIWFPLAARSDKYHSKKIIYGVENNGEFMAIPEEYPDQAFVLGGEELNAQRNEFGEISVYKSGKNIIATRMYWFAWYAYHPDTKVLE